LKETSGLLLDVELPDYSGYDYIRLNAGKMENKGIELAISTVNVDKEFKWNTDFNISFNRNKVKSLELNEVYYYAPIYSNNQQAILMRPGLPLGTFFGYVSEGVDPQTGNIVYKDLNNNGTINEADRTVIGYAQPNFIYGMTNSFTYKNFNLAVFLQGSQGNDIFNATRVDLEGMFDNKNQSTDVLSRWKQEGDITNIPKATPGNLDNVRNSTRFVENGSYLRVKSISLTYNVKAKFLNTIGITKLSLYATGQNLFTLTDYSGFDPEVNAFGTIRSADDPNAVNKGTELGVDYGTYPQSKAVIFGLNVQF
jgi:TonB-dependent starch-binding outer membrane protein SusC